MTHPTRDLYGSVVSSPARLRLPKPCRVWWWCWSSAPEHLELPHHYTNCLIKYRNASFCAFSPSILLLVWLFFHFSFFSSFYPSLFFLPPVDLIIYFKVVVAERRGRDTQRDFPSLDSLRRWPQWPVLGQTEIRKQKFHSGLPHGGQGPKHREALLFFPGH